MAAWEMALFEHGAAVDDALVVVDDAPLVEVELVLAGGVDPLLEQAPRTTAPRRTLAQSPAMFALRVMLTPPLSDSDRNPS
jgi:hypothetical protein